MPRSKALQIFDAGLQLPTGAAAGRVLSSDASGNGTWTTQPIPVVSALPGSPADGDQIYFQNTAMGNAGVIWQLRYRAAIGDAYKWEFVGGGPLQNDVGTAQAVGTSSVYVNLATDGPTITAPLAGIYSCNFGARITLTARTITVQVGVAVGDTNAVVPMIVVQSPDSGAAYVQPMQVTCSGRRAPTVAAGNAIKLRYLANQTTNHTIQDRWLDVLPMRVG
jgi:hypothetical protein